MTIARLLERRSGAVITCDAGQTVRLAVASLAQQRIGAMPVLRGGALAGIFSERDVIYRLHDEGESVLDRPVEAVMTAPALTVEPGTEVLEALSLMTERRVRHLPVMQGGAMVGFISIGDLVKYRIDCIESEAQAMRSYIQMA